MATADPPDVTRREALGLATAVGIGGALAASGATGGILTGEPRPALAASPRTKRSRTSTSITGRLTFLRVEDVSTRDRNPDLMEVVVALDSAPGRKFGFRFQDDEYMLARKSLFYLLRDAFRYDWTVTIVFHEASKAMGTITQLTLAK